MSTSGFYGFTVDNVTRLVPIAANAEPATLGVKVLAYAEEMNPATTRKLAAQLRVVDADEIPDRHEVERYLPFRAVWAGLPWADILADVHTTISGALIAGVAADAEVYGDASWGYVLNFDDDAFEVYRAALHRPAGYRGRVLIDSCYILTTYYLSNLPSREQFIEGVLEDIRG